mgnify:CR=1 FL=1
MRPEVIQGDVREVLKTLDDESVQCVVTSPPYWGLRDYGTATWEGGDENCEHTINDGTYDPKKGIVVERPDRSSDKSCCIRCGAKRIDAQLGLEATPEEFVENMVDVFREVKRVLRNDGTLWLNLGDSYAGSNGSRGITENTPSVKKGDKVLLKRIEGRNFTEHKQGGMPIVSPDSIGLKHKDLVGIPWRVALALQADGWYLRSDIIWNKPNPMPEPVKDRPTKAHEYIFLLTKSPKYYYDADAIRVPLSEISKQFLNVANGNPLREVDGFSKEKRYSTGGKLSRAEMGNFVNPNGANKRSVWKITTKPYKGAHFATFPEELPETCIKAGTSKAGCCSKCGKPYKRIVETGDKYSDEVYVGQATKDYKSAKAQNPSDVKRRVLESMREKTTVGWEVDCDCNAEKVPCVVLDIFAGSGTTLRVASKLGRKGIGIELNPEYIKILKKRCKIESMSLEAFV